LRQFQVVPGKDHLTDVDGTRASAEQVVRSALCEIGADVLVTTEVVESIKDSGTGAKEELVATTT
jgi:hypothetical protein